MKILAFDSSGMVASVALTEDDILLGEYTTNHKKTHSQTLLPMLDELMKMLSMDVKDVDVLALANGPGSFTGLRIGAATVKGLSLALDKPVVTVPTLLGLAYNMWGSDHVICPLMDARRNQVYSALYYCGEKLERVSDYMAQDIDEVISQVLEIDENAVFLGDGVPVFMDKLKQYDTFTLAPVSANMQRSACVGAIALEMTDKAVDCNKFEIMYLRKSQAERELEEKNGTSTIK